MLAIGSELRAQLSLLYWHLTSPLRSDHEECAPQKMLPNRRAGLWKSAPNCKILKKGSGWKSLSQSWLRPWTWTLEIWISFQPWPWISSSVSICLLPLPNVICLHCPVYKTLWGKQLALAMLLCNTAHNRILVLPQVCWPGSNEIKKRGRKGVNSSKSVKIFKDRRLQEVQMNLNWRSNFSVATNYCK